MRNIFGIIVVVICMINCSRPKSTIMSLESLTSVDTMAYVSNPDTFLTHMLDTVIWLPLEASDINIMRDISKVSVAKNKIIVGSKYLGGLYVYDIASGKHLYSVEKKGNGPGEYLELSSFAVTPTSIYILDNYSNAILRYSIEDGSFIEKKKIQFVAWDMEAFDDDTFLFTWLSNNPDAPKPDSAPEYAVWKTDNDFRIINTYLPVENDYNEMYGKSRYFTKHGDEIIFHSLKYNGYFSFTKKDELKFHFINFSNPLPENRPLRLSDVEGTSWQYLGETPFVTDKFAVVDIAEGGDGMQLFASGDKVYGNSMKCARNIPVNIVGVTDDNMFIGYINDNNEQYEQLVEYGFQKGTTEVEKLLRNGGCCLIFYKMSDN